MGSLLKVTPNLSPSFAVPALGLCSNADLLAPLVGARFHASTPFQGQLALLRSFSLQSARLMYRWGSTSLRATSQLPRELSQFPQRSLSPAVATQIDAADCTAWGVWQTAYTCSVSVVALVVSGSFCDPMDCIACQAPLSMGFSRQESWCGLPFPPPGELLDPGIDPESLCLLHWKMGSIWEALSMSVQIQRPLFL